MFSSNSNHKLKALGINIYGGGFTIGVMKHFDVLAQWEEFKLGRRSFLLNFPTLESPLCDWEAWPVNKMKGVDFIYANPPCVPWSSASSYSARTGQVGTRYGKRVEHRFQDPLLKLTDNTMRTAMKLKPRVFISESVENGFNTGAVHYEQYVKMWQELGYSVTYFLTDAVLHGASCRRRRFHFIAHNVKLVLPPAPDVKKLRVYTVRDAIGDLASQPLVADDFQHEEAVAGRWNDAKYRKYLRRCPPMGMLRAHVPPDFNGPKPSIFCRKLAWDIPAPTMMGFNKLIHPDGNRWITYREGLRLMSYPDKFRIAGHSDVDAYDAVIPVVANVLATIAKKSIENNSRKQKVDHEIVDWRPLGVGLSGKVALITKVVRERRRP